MLPKKSSRRWHLSTAANGEQDVTAVEGLSQPAMDFTKEKAFYVFSEEEKDTSLAVEIGEKAQEDFYIYFL